MAGTPRPAQLDGGVEGPRGAARGADPGGAAVLGVLKQPWSLTVAAALVLVHNHSAFVVAVIAFALFAVVSTATVGAIYV